MPWVRWAVPESDSKPESAMSLAGHGGGSRASKSADSAHPRPPASLRNDRNESTHEGGYQERKRDPESSEITSDTRHSVQAAASESQMGGRASSRKPPKTYRGTLCRVAASQMCWGAICKFIKAFRV